MLIIKKLGGGDFADVFLANLNEQYVAVKIPNNRSSKEKALKWALNEVNILKYFMNSKYIMNLISYEINETNNSIIVELLGDELDVLIQHYRKYNKNISISVIKHLAKQILYGVSEMRQANILHNDIKVENILFTKVLPLIFKQSDKKMVKYVSKIIQNNSLELRGHFINYCWVLKDIILLSTNVKITDFGNAYTAELAKRKPSFNHCRPTRYYISPEMLLRSPFWVESDMWSVGCLFYELLTCRVMFDPYRDNNMGVNSMHIMHMIKVFGPLPYKMIKVGKKSKRYFSSKKFKFQYLVLPKPLSYLFHYYHINEREIPGIVDFLMPIFRYDPAERITPDQCLKADWLC